MARSEDVPVVGAWAEPVAMLEHVLGSVATQPSPPAVLVHAPNSPRIAQALVRQTLAQYQARHPRVCIAHISPLVSCTPRLLYTHVLRQLHAGAEACADASTFLRLARAHVQPHAKCIIAVHDAERIRDLWPEHVWEMWPGLAESLACQGRLTVLFLSRLPWSAFRSVSGRTTSLSPVCIRVPRLPRDDALALLDHAASALDVPDVGVYRTATRLVYDAVKDTVRDEHELRLLHAHVWRAILPAAQSGASAAALLPRVSEACRAALARVLPRLAGPSDASAAAGAHARAPEPEPALPLTRTGYGAIPAFLLISAFLASYNPAITDVKYFVRELEASRKRRRGKAHKAARAALVELEGNTDKVFDLPQFWGPRPFTLERVLAIYHALLSDFEHDLNEDALLAPAERAARAASHKSEMHLSHVSGEFWSRSAVALAELNELVRQQLIVRMSPANKLGAMQYRVNASFEYVRHVAHAVGFPLTVWLWDTYT